MRAENDLHRAGIGVVENRFQVARQIRLVLVQRLENGDGGMMRRRGCRAVHKALRQQSGQQGIARANHCDGAKRPAQNGKSQHHAHANRPPATHT